LIHQPGDRLAGEECEPGRRHAEAPDLEDLLSAVADDPVATVMALRGATVAREDHAVRRRNTAPFSVGVPIPLAGNF
jgi:hypothetical protein